VTESDVVVGVGRIAPHEFGYSGGAKIVLPGVSGRLTIGHNHSMVSLPGVEVGNLKGNPLRKDMEEAATLAGLDFIINAILNNKKEIVGVVAGNFIDAHREGTRIADRVYGVEVDEPADVVIASPELRGYTVQEDVTCLAAAQLVKKGGTLVYVSACEEGLGEESFVRTLKSRADKSEIMKEVEKVGWGGAGMAYLGMRTKQKCTVVIVSERSKEELNEIGFEYAGSVEEALTDARKRMGRYGTVTVVRNGTSILPRIVQTKTA
jgi:nickel-dependent lactate racemase